MSFLWYMLVLNFLVSQTTGNKNALLKNMLARSLTKVRQMLVDIEGKIEHERKILSEIDEELSHKGGKVTLDDNMDYLNADIWWKHDAGTTNSHGSLVKFDDGSVTILTTPSIIPKPSSKAIIYPTTPLNWIKEEEDHVKAAFLADMKAAMESDQHGYFTAFLTRFTELVYTKNTTQAYLVLYFMVDMTKKQIDAGKFQAMDDLLIENIKTVLTWFDNLSAKIIQEQAGVLHFMLKAKYTMTKIYVDFLDFYDKMFSKEEGEALFVSLIPFFNYPVNVTFMPMVENMFKAALLPYFREEGKRKQRKLIQQLMNVMDSFQVNQNNQLKYEYDRRMSKVGNRDIINANHSTKGHNESDIPERRSMNYKRIVKHLLVKHPELFRKIKRRIKYDNRHKHHHLSRKRKRHHSHSQNYDRHQIHRYLHKQELARRRGHDKSGNNLENGKDETDSTENSAYYHDRVQGIQKGNDQLKQQKSKQRQNKGPVETMSTTAPKQYNLQYLTQLAINFLRKKQQGKKTDKARRYNQNFYRNRRRNIPSSEEETCNHSEYFQDSIDNDKPHKINEASSYSDEEDELTNNLHDALTRGNWTFESLRKSGDMNNKQTLRGISSETDKEWILKNNTYKVFEQEKSL